MSEEDLEEWDAAFLEEIVQVEERALSSSSSSFTTTTTFSIGEINPPCFSYLHPPPPSLPPPSHHPSLYLPPPLPSCNHPSLHVPPPLPSRIDYLSYSPPRELSQRTTDYAVASTSGVGLAKLVDPLPPLRGVGGSDDAKDLEIERLKKELGRVSKQLAELEHECLEIKKERTQKDQRTFTNLKNEAKEANFEGSRIANIEHGISVAAHHGVVEEFPNAKAYQIGQHIAKSSCKAVGVQIDLNACLDLSEKLNGIWGLSNDQKFGRNLISKLFAVCSADIDVLFGFIHMSSPSRTTEPMAVKSSVDKTLQSFRHPSLRSEAAKVSHFYSVLTKISSGMLQLEALFESLFDLCGVENVVIVYRSLHILHVLLKHILTFERKSGRRDNISVEHLRPWSRTDHMPEYEIKGRGFTGMDGTHASCTAIGVRQFEAAASCKEGHCSTGSSFLFSHINWIHLFELMRLITVSNSEECVRLEALSIMNIILTRSDSYMEREKFGLIEVFGSISQLLKKEAGLLVQKEAVHTLYLLLNCPKLVFAFCSGCKMTEAPDAVNDEENTAASQGFTMILKGLVDCIASCGNSFKALELRKSAITLLAFIASSGKSGFEILVNYKLSREANFLTLILQVLASEVDFEAAVNSESEETFRARTLLIREVLILLNRLVSSPAHSATVLRLLTNSRDMVSLTLDVANRLSRKQQKPRQSDNITKQMRESEIVDLGRIFKRRVSTYLGQWLAPAVKNDL